MPDIRGTSGGGFKQRSMDHSRPAPQSPSVIPTNPGRPSGAQDSMPRNRQAKKSFIPPWALSLMQTGQAHANPQMASNLLGRDVGGSGGQQMPQPGMQQMPQPGMQQMPQPGGQQMPQQGMQMPQPEVQPAWQQALQKRAALMRTLGR